MAEFGLPIDGQNGGKAVGGAAAEPRSGERSGSGNNNHTIRIIIIKIMTYYVRT
jgi:hypothetical protein